MEKKKKKGSQGADGESLRGTSGSVQLSFVWHVEQVTLRSFRSFTVMNVECCANYQHGHSEIENRTSTNQKCKPSYSRSLGSR